MSPFLTEASDVDRLVILTVFYILRSIPTSLTLHTENTQENTSSKVMQVREDKRMKFYVV
jgi:hypothetical protein